jgi:uncharacterized membrane protein YkgB
MKKRFLSLSDTRLLISSFAFLLITIALLVFAPATEWKPAIATLSIATAFSLIMLPSYRDIIVQHMNDDFTFDEEKRFDGYGYSNLLGILGCIVIMLSIIGVYAPVIAIIAIVLGTICFTMVLLYEMMWRHIEIVHQLKRIRERVFRRFL